MNRVVITGSGTVNALGTDVSETLLSMQEGKCGIGPLKFRDVDRLSIKIGAQIKGYTETDYFNRQELVLYDRVTQFAILAARQAVNESGLIFDGELSENSGVLSVSYTHFRAHETVLDLVCRLLLEKKNF